MKNNGIKKVYIETFGCQMNKLDSELVLGRLEREGYSLTDSRDEADLILMNTCSVREHAEERVFSRAASLKPLKLQRPELIIGVIGCMAQNQQEKIVKRLPHVDMVVGPRELDTIPALIHKVRERKLPAIALNKEFDEVPEQYRSAEGRETPFQAFVKVMEGCDCACTFCIVPTVRGRETSRPPDDIVKEVEQLALGGCVEITLLGQTVNSYGKQLKPRTNLGSLLHRLNDIDAVRRIRFITSHPSFMFKDIVDAMRDLSKVCKYLHIPIQSGSNKILKAMRRGYTVERYREIVDTLRAEVAGIEIASDFIVGFPGEDESDFQATTDLMKDIRFQNSFVFKYSPRPGTPAAGVADDVPQNVKKERNQILLDIQEKISEEKNRRSVGKTMEVLVEGTSKRNAQRQTGRSDTNQIVLFESPKDLRGTFVKVKITDSKPLTLFGEIV